MPTPAKVYGTPGSTADSKMHHIFNSNLIAHISYLNAYPHNKPFFWKLEDISVRWEQP